MFRATATVFASQGVKSVAQFARNIAIVRLLSVQDFGIASTFVIIFTLIEAATDIGLNRLVVQDRDGDRPGFLATIHGVQVARGIAGAALVYVLAWPYAAVLNLPDLVWAYHTMALVPLIRGFMHHDIYRAQREMRFLPMGLAQGLSPILSLAVVGGSYLITPDYRIALWALIGQQVFEVALSHWLARRPYRVAWDAPVVRRAIRFGLPLMVNGLLLFVMMNGDRIIVGNQLGMRELGFFSAAFMLTLIPSTILASALASLALPLLSRAQEDADQTEFHRLSLMVIELNLAIAGLFALGFALFGPAVMRLAFGAQYAEGLALIAPLALVQAVRVCKTGPATIAMSRGVTSNPLIANLFRALSLPVAYVLVLGGGGLTAIILTAIAAEALGAAVALWLARRRLGVPTGRLWPAYLATAALVAACLIDAYAVPAPPAIPDHAHAAQLGLLVLFCLLLLTLRRIVPALRLMLAARRRRAP